MDLQQSIKDRFIAAVQQTFPKPTPLIGPKWFVFPPSAKPAHFQFIGVTKLAKATGMPAKKVAALLVKNLQLGPIKGEVQVTEDNKINLVLAKEQAAGDAAGKPAEPGADATAPSGEKRS